MRKGTINLITLYMSIGAVINVISILLILFMNISKTESLLTIIAINGCIVVLFRDVAIKHEIVCNNKKIRHTQIQKHVQ